MALCWRGGALFACSMCVNCEPARRFALPVLVPAGGIVRAELFCGGERFSGGAYEEACRKVTAVWKIRGRPICTSHQPCNERFKYFPIEKAGREVAASRFSSSHSRSFLRAHLRQCRDYIRPVQTPRRPAIHCHIINNQAPCCVSAGEH